jgi:hypothetical protein
MPSYNNTPFALAPKLLTAGWPEFLLGSFPTDVSPTRFQVTNVALASNVATVSGYVREGNIPTAGSLISIQGTATASGAFNVSNATITGVTIDATSGIGTITFTVTHADVATVADSGLAIVPQPVKYEALANGSSIPAVPPANDPNTDAARTFTAQVYFASLPTTATVTVQGSLTNNDADYQNIGTVATVVSGGVTLSQAQFQLTNERFLRFNVSSVTGGTSPTIAAAILG